MMAFTIRPLRMAQGRVAALFGFGLLAAAAIFVAPAAQAVPATKAPVYAIDDYPFQKAPALLRWRSVLEREEAQMARADPDDCKAGEPRIACAAKEVLLLEEKLKDLSPAEQVEAVYAYFNAITWKEHAPNCGVDCWKTRLEFLADREGDCGDHALAEYFTLKRLGFKERDLQLIVAQMPGFADSFKGGHVVLRVRAEGEYFILDNRRSDVADLSGLRRYKVLAGMNADSVQIYNLVTPTPPPGFVADATQVAALITSPGAAELPPADVQVADATPETFSTQVKPTLVAATAPVEAEPAVAETEDTAAEDDSETACMQSATLADWDPFLPCTPTKQMKIVVNAKTIIGAEPPKSLEPMPSKPIVVAAAEPEAASPKAPEPEVEKPKIVAKTIVTPAAPAPEPESKEAEAEDDSGSCTQGATLADWNPDLPCGDGNASSLRIQFSD